jgi:hypothetical protein
MDIGSAYRKNYRTLKQEPHVTDTDPTMGAASPKDISERHTYRK